MAGAGWVRTVRDMNETDIRTTSRATVSPATLVAGFLAAFLVVNTYWGLGGTGGVAWIMGCECPVPLAMVWAQEAAIVAGIAVVLSRAGTWQLPVPRWVPRAGVWAMAASFGAVGLHNLLGDNTTQARFLFAPVALALCGLCVAVAKSEMAQE